jgi:hypothetical protein
VNTLKIITNNDLLRKPDTWFTVPQIALKYKVSALGNMLINLKNSIFMNVGVAEGKERKIDQNTV